MWYGQKSVYQEKFKDPLGKFFTEENFPELKTNKDDVSCILQKAIDDLVKEQQYGIVYIPEGEYPIKRTILIPPSVRLIGYGKKRPAFVLPPYTKGFDGINQDETMPRASEQDSFPNAAYMFWFIGNKDTKTLKPQDANAGTFYSAISNIDFRIKEGNPYAICIKAHFAQHGFVSHCHFDLGDGLAAFFDVGNEMEDLTVEGGQYGMVCRMCSPGWPFVLLDSVFNNQKKAAILTNNTGFNAIRVKVSNTPKVFDLYVREIFSDNHFLLESINLNKLANIMPWEKLYIEDCIFENISETAITSYRTGNMAQQTNLVNLYCKNVPVLINKADIDEKVKFECGIYHVKDYCSGIIESDDKENLEETNTITKAALYDEIVDISPLKNLPLMIKSDIPAIPPMENWVSVFDYGVKGDGKADDTQALQKIFDNEKYIYFPQGVYKITDTLYLKRDCYVYGLSPVSTQIVIDDDTPEFAGFGTPKALIETAKGGFLYFNGIGIDTAGRNPRAAGIKWMAGETSYMNDVKFVGGHGLMFRDGRDAYAYLYNPSRTADYNPDRIWDCQYASLWITNNGGGVFKDIWSASPYAEAGIAITNTNTYGKMYVVSLEHHVRSEIKMNNVHNWKFYALQTEEEKAEGLECLPVELVSCTNISFINLLMFRVVAVDRPYMTGVRLWDCNDIQILNFYNKAQMQYTFTLALQDMTSSFYAKAPEYARLTIKGKKAGDLEAEKSKFCDTNNKYKVIFNNNIFAQGPAFDAEGNLYWCDKIQKRIYKYDVKRDLTVPFFDIHFVPSTLVSDKTGNLMVVVDYSELKTYIPGKSYFEFNADIDNPFFSWFHKRGEKVYSVALDNPYNTMTQLKRVSADEVSPKAVFRPAHIAYYERFNEIAETKIEEYYMALDGETALMATVDLARSLVLKEAVADKNFIMTDDISYRTYSFEVTEGGNLANGELISEIGQYNCIADKDDIYYTVADKLYGFKDGKIVSATDVLHDTYTVVGHKDDVYLIGRETILKMNY